MNDYNDKKLMTSSIELTFKYSITVYDALYLALDQKIKCPLITADEKFVNKVKSGNENIILLRNYRGQD